MSRRDRLDPLCDGDNSFTITVKQLSDRRTKVFLWYNPNLHLQQIIKYNASITLVDAVIHKEWLYNHFTIHMQNSDGAKQEVLRTFRFERRYSDGIQESGSETQPKGCPHAEL